jgi:cytochrome c551/c552
LYVSTGDNSTPFDEPHVKYVNSGFGPMNDIPGHMQYDARRSSSNTNDLRGKILRIRIKDDGTYEIPDKNLFPKGEAGTRPEIYVMGNRNPYRISVDQKNSYLYWGEVGPDANADSLDTRGPRGYDEVNQARKAGYFGWPLFVGNNYAYRAYNYETGESGPAYDPAKPVNNSRNNTGLKELPAAHPAFIWYPYGASHDFPDVGTGGRNAMAGPVYYTDMFPKQTRLPDYYDHKLFIYDWIRGWIKAVTMLPDGEFDVMEPFMEHTRLNNCIDMETGPDGKLYLLEYGTGWFAKNPDAGLSRIDFLDGNRAPKIASVNIDKTAGSLPFTIKATVDAMDPEKDKLTYIWDLGNKKTKETDEPELNYTYEQAGDYNLSVTVKDPQGDSTKSNVIEIYAGNETPVVDIRVNGGNKSFYIPGLPFTYAVTVTDKNDTSKIDLANLFVSVEYAEGYDKAGSTMGHQQGEATISGKNIMLSLDCKSCHKEAEKSIGPSFLQVSQKYAKDPNASSYLAQKIIKGGGGVWGEVVMAAHPTLPQSDVSQIVQWILSLSNKDVVKKSLPASGNIIPETKPPNTALILSASYTDKGGNNIKALTGRNSVVLRSNSLLFTGKEAVSGYAPISFNGANYLIVPLTQGWFSVEGIDLTGVRSVNLLAGWQEAPKFGFDFEIKLDAPDGKTVGKGSLLPPQDKKSQQGMAHIPLDAINDNSLHKLYIVSKPKDAKEKAQAGAAGLQFNSK